MQPDSTALVVTERRAFAIRPATSAETDEQLLQSWLASLNSPNSRRNFEQTGRAFLAGLPDGLRAANIEQVRLALDAISVGRKASTSQQYVLRCKSLMKYAHELGYTQFNVGAAIKVRSGGNRGAKLAKRIISETEVALLIRAARSKRDRMLLQVAYAAGLRISEIVGLSWPDVIARDKGRVQLSIAGKGGKLRQVLLPAEVSGGLRALAPPDAAGPVFCGRSGLRLGERAVFGMLKRTAKRAGLPAAVSPHWLRHAHGSHALDRGATLPEVQETLGHDNIATTSGYLHARPDSSSGLRLDPGIFRQSEQPPA
jgi:site-specific recombinase XerD